MLIPDAHAMMSLNTLGAKAMTCGSNCRACAILF